METGGMKLNFLELPIIDKDDWKIFNWYRKFFLGRLLNYYSHLTFYTQKKGVFMNLFDKVLLLSHPFQQKNFSLTINILFDNSYFLEFFFSIQKKIAD